MDWNRVIDDVLIYYGIVLIFIVAYSIEIWSLKSSFREFSFRLVLFWIFIVVFGLQYFGQYSDIVENEVLKYSKNREKYMDVIRYLPQTNEQIIAYILFVTVIFTIILLRRIYVARNT